MSVSFIFVTLIITRVKLYTCRIFTFWFLNCQHGIYLNADDKTNALDHKQWKVRRELRKKYLLCPLKLWPGTFLDKTSSSVHSTDKNWTRVTSSQLYCKHREPTCRLAHANTEPGKFANSCTQFLAVHNTNHYGWQGYICIQNIRFYSHTVS